MLRPPPAPSRDSDSIHLVIIPAVLRPGIKPSKCALLLRTSHTGNDLNSMKQCRLMNCPIGDLDLMSMFDSWWSFCRIPATCLGFFTTTFVSTAGPPVSAGTGSGTRDGVVPATSTWACSNRRRSTWPSAGPAPWRTLIQSPALARPLCWDKTTPSMETGLRGMPR